MGTQSLSRSVFLSRFLGVSLATLLSASVATAATDLSNSITGTLSDGVGTINYRLFTPTGVADDQRVPLILYLHGAGDRGTDNVSQTVWMDQLQQHTKSGQHAARILAPQISATDWFSSSTSTPTEAMKLTMQELQQQMADPHVDPSRIYITGVSMGAFGTWEALNRNPTLFAAAIPMSGGYDPSIAPNIKNIPIWAFHGSADSVVDVQGTRDMIAALQAAGGNPKYTEIPGADHVIWPQVYADPDNTLYSWLFGQSLNGDITQTNDLLARGDPILPQLNTVSAAQVVPEPASLALILTACATLLPRRRCR